MKSTLTEISGFSFRRWSRIIPLLILAIAVITVGTNVKYNSFTSGDAYAAVTGASKHIVSIVQSNFKGTQLWGHVPVESLADTQSVTAELTGKQIEAMTRKVVEMAGTDEGGLSTIFKPSDWICIKINMVCVHGYTEADGPSHVTWSPGKTTDLRIVKTFMELLAEERLGKRITLVEGSALAKPKEMVPEKGFDGWSTKWGGYYDNLSYEDVLADLNKRYPNVKFDYVDLNYDETIEIEVPIGSVSTLNPKIKYHIPVAVLNCDKMVSISNMKTHSSSRLTLSMKNYIGIAPGKIYGFPKALLHQNTNVDEAIIDLFAFKPACYSIIGGIVGVEGKGPQNGDDIRRNLVIAGTDPVATDAVGAVVMGFNPWDIDYFHLAAQKGFGTLDIDSVEVRGTTIEEARRPFKKPPYGKIQSYYGRGIRKWAISGFNTGAGLDDTPLGDEATLRPKAGDTMWVSCLGPDDYVDLKKHFNYKATNGISYSFCEFLSSEQGDAFLWVDGDDGLKIWLNDQLVYTNPSIGPYKLVKDKVPIKIRRGKNHILVKAKNTFGDYCFRLQIVDSENDGDTMMGLKFREP